MKLIWLNDHLTYTYAYSNSQCQKWKRTIHCFVCGCSRLGVNCLQVSLKFEMMPLLLLQGLAEVKDSSSLVPFSEIIAFKICQISLHISSIIDRKLVSTSMNCLTKAATDIYQYAFQAAEAILSSCPFIPIGVSSQLSSHTPGVTIQLPSLDNQETINKNMKSDSMQPM